MTHCPRKLGLVTLVSLVSCGWLVACSPVFVADFEALGDIVLIGGQAILQNPEQAKVVTGSNATFRPLTLRSGGYLQIDGSNNSPSSQPGAKFTFDAKASPNSWFHSQEAGDGTGQKHVIRGALDFFTGRKDN